MLKHSIISALLFGAAMGVAVAAPVRPSKLTVTQPDGSTVTLRMVGDERFHSLATNDGLAVARNAEGQFVYRLSDGSLSSVAAHNLGQRTAAEASFLSDRIHEVSVDVLWETSAVKSAKLWAKPERILKRAASRAASSSKAPLASTFTDCPSLGERKSLWCSFSSLM